MQQHRMQFKKLAEGCNDVDYGLVDGHHSLRQSRGDSLSSRQMLKQPHGQQNNISGSSERSPSQMKGAGTFGSAEDLQREPMAIANPPQMTEQFSPFKRQQNNPQYEHENDMAYFVRLKEVQEKVTILYPAFPLQAHKDFLENNYEMIIRRSASQIDYLFGLLQQSRATSPLQKILDQNGQDPNQSMQLQRSNESVQKLMNDNQVSTQSIFMLKTSLTKADDIVKNLRIENEYFQRQLENLRKEIEQTKVPQSGRARSLDRVSHTSRENGSNFFMGNEFNDTGRAYEPLQAMPQPVPHPRLNAPMMHGHEMQVEDLHSRRDQSSPRKGSAGPAKRQNSRGSNPPGKRGGGAHSGGRKPQHGRKTPLDENLGITTVIEPGLAKDAQDQELRALRFELQQTSEVLILKTETVRNLQEQLEQQRRRLTTEAQKTQFELQKDVKTLRVELQMCKTDEIKKEAGLTELKRQCEELTKSRTIEISLLVNKKPAPAGSLQKQISEESEKKSGTKASGKNGTHSKALKNLQFAKELNAEMELMFADDDLKIKKPALKKQKKGKKGQQAQIAMQLTGIDDMNPAIAKHMLLSSDVLLQNQIQAAFLAESLIDELQAIESDQTTEVSDLKNSCTSLEVHSKTLQEEKQYLSQRVTELSRTNDDLKRKFSALLDQFQEYVTLQETKQADNEEKQKQQQEALLTNMQDNIKELEQVTESLQSELHNKEEVFEVLKRENRDMQQKLVQKVQEENVSSQQAMRRIEDELGFLKRHHDLEINMLKEQYERSLETAKLIAQETAKLKADQPPGPSHLQQELNCRDTVSIAGRSESIRLSDNQTYSQMHQSQNNLHNQSTFVHHGVDQSQYKEQMRRRSNSPMLTPPVAPEIQESTNARAKEMLTSTHTTFEKLKKDLSDKEQLLEEKNREILRLRIASEEMGRYVPGAAKRDQIHHDTSMAQLSSEQRGQIIADLSYSIDQLRAELMRVKQTLFAQIGKHINFDAPTHLQGSTRQIQREEDMHSEVIIQLSEIRALISLTQEVNMLAQNSLNQRTASVSDLPNLHSPDNMAKSGGQAGKTNLDNNYQIKRNADQLLRQNHISGLHDLVLDQITRSESLMSDNALMQRQLYKYETTLAELDVILRSDKRDKSIFELKKLVETQLKQILVLQKELEQARQGGLNASSHSPIQQSQPSFMPSNINKPMMDPAQQKEVESLRFQLQEQRMANEEVISERRNLMEMAESFENKANDSHRSMERALNRVSVIEKELEEKTSELEDIRLRITKVAELFERKEIKQKYSFEVLSDFIHDKAKRLFAKYDSVSKERKVMQEEKNFYFQRKLDQLEQENFSMKETNRAAERIIHELVPNMAQLLDHPMIQGQELSEYYYARTVLEQIEIEYRSIKKAHMILQERNNELMLQIDAYKNDAVRSMTTQRQGQNSTIENCAPNSQQQSFGNITTTGGLAGKTSAVSSANQPYRNTAPRSPYDMKLSEARAQEQQEVQTAMRSGNTGAPVTNNGQSWPSPMQPKNSYQGPAQGGNLGLTHLRSKSIERDNKDSPLRSHSPWAKEPTMGGSVGLQQFAERTSAVQPSANLSASVGYQGVMGSHLTTNENNK